MSTERLVAVDDSLAVVFAVSNTRALVADTTQSISTAAGALVVSGGMSAKGLVGNAIFTGLSSFGNAITGNSTIGTLASSTNVIASVGSIGGLAAGNASIGVLVLGGALSLISSTIGNVVSSSSSIASLIVSNSINLSSPSTIGSLNVDSWTVKILECGDMTVGNVFVSGGSILDSVTMTNAIITGGFAASTVTIPNVVDTSMSFGSLTTQLLQSSTLNVSSSASIGNASIGNANFTLATLGSIFCTSTTLGNARINTDLASTSAVTLGNLRASVASVGTVRLTNAVAGSISTGTLSAPSGTFSNLSSTNASYPSLVATSGTIGGMVLSGSVNAAAGTIDNLIATSVSATSLSIPGAANPINSIFLPPASVLDAGNLSSQVIQIGLRKTTGASTSFLAALRATNNSALYATIDGANTYINTSANNIRFSTGTQTSGSVLVIKSPLAGDTTGTTGTVQINGPLILGSINVTPNTGDIHKEVTFAIANNQTTLANVTGLLFPEATTRSFTCLMSLSILATQNMYTQYILTGVQRATGDWVIGGSYIGDESGIQFGITSASGFGQVQYTSTNNPGFTSGKFVFVADVSNIF